MLSMTELAALLRCHRCKHAPLSSDGQAVACAGCGARQPVQGQAILFEDAQADMSDEWRKLQEAGEAEYQEGRGISAQQLNERPSEGIEAISRLFGAFMAVTLDRRHKVLDVGSGISRDLPLYVRDLDPESYVGLEPLITPGGTGYPVLMGAVAENLPIADGAFDAVMFATSMDHIEGIDEAVAEAIRVIRSDGRLYMWIGLYDPDTIAHMKTFHNIMLGGPVKRVLRFAAAHVEYSYTLWQMRERRRKLARGERIDPYHCRYYTRESVAASLEKWKLRSTRALIVPGTNSMFVEAVRA